MHIHYSTRGRYMKSFTSHAAHLTGLCWIFEYDNSPKIGKALLNWYNKKPDKKKVPEPENKGTMTIVDIYKAKNAEEYTMTCSEMGSRSLGSLVGISYYYT